MSLIETPLNPIPHGAAVLPIETRDGVSLRCASWSADGPARGTVMLLQGRAEFIEKYFETVATLRMRGFAVLTFDWRGQGGSERTLPNRHVGHVRHFDDFRLDYEAVRARLADGGPVTVLAHSMGAAIALVGAHEGWLRADRLVCTNPMVGLSMVRAQPFTRRLARLLTRAGLKGRMVPGGRTHSISTLPFPGNRLSSDEARYERNRQLATALGWSAIGSPTIGWLDAAYETMARLGRPGVSAAIALPTLMVLSRNDPVCSTPVMSAFAEALANGRVVILPDARHEILMETDAVLAAFWEAFDSFVAEDRAAAGASGASARRSTA